MAEHVDEVKHAGRVECPRRAAARVGFCAIWEGVECCSGEVEAVHGDYSSEGLHTARVEALHDFRSYGGLPRAWGPCKDYDDASATGGAILELFFEATRSASEQRISRLHGL